MKRLLLLALPALLAGCPKPPDGGAPTPASTPAASTETAKPEPVSEQKPGAADTVAKVEFGSPGTIHASRCSASPNRRAVQTRSSWQGRLCGSCLRTRSATHMAGLWETCTWGNAS